MVEVCFYVETQTLREREREREIEWNELCRRCLERGGICRSILATESSRGRVWLRSRAGAAPVFGSGFTLS